MVRFWPPAREHGRDERRGGKREAAPKSADVCRNDLKAFNSQIEKDGYWYTADGYGFVPVDAAALECTAESGGGAFKGTPLSRGRATPMGGRAMRCASSSPLRTSWRGKDNSNPARRPHGDPRSLKALFVRYETEGTPAAECPAGVNNRSQPPFLVMGSNALSAPTGLSASKYETPTIGARQRRRPRLESQDGKFGYLVMARGGIFGFDETRIPVPWKDLKTVQRETAGARHNQNRARCGAKG